MADTRGTFRLKNVRQDILNDEYVPIPAVWVSDTTTTGYYAGGYVGGNVNIPYPTPSSIENATAVSKLTYSSSSIAREPSANLPDKNVDSGPFTSSSAGYMLGGVNNAQGRNTYLRKLTYSSDTTANVPGGTVGPSWGWQAMATFNDGDTKGYATGGKSGPSQDPVGGTNLTRSMPFSTQTWGSIPTIGTAIGHNGQPIVSSTAGYVAGGRNDFTPGPAGFLRSWMQKFTFSTDANSRTPSMDLTYSIKMMSGASNTDVGYLMGGGTVDTNYTSVTSQIQKFTYSTETASLNPSNMLSTNIKGSATGNSTDGFSAGGFDNNPIYTNVITQINFSTGTTSNSGATLPQGARSGVGAFSSVQSPLPDSKLRWFDNASQTPKTGYCMTGEPYGVNMQKLVMPTDSVTQLPSPNSLDLQVYKNAATGNTSNGYWSGGLRAPGSPDSTYSVSVIQKFVYSTDVGENNPTRYNPTKQQHQSAGSNATDGYFFSGIKQPGNNYDFTQIYKLTYATDAVSTLPTHMLASAYYNAATNSRTSSYLCGQKLNEQALKLNFSTETNTLLPGVFPLAYTRRQRLAACGNSDVGYWGGGMAIPSSNAESSINKITFSTDTGEASPSKLSQARYYLSAVSNTEDGYWLGGFPQHSARVDKTSFTTETTQNIPALESTKFGPGGPSQCSQFAAAGPQSDGVSGIIPAPPAATPTSPTSLTGPEGIKAEGYLFQGIQGPSTTPTGRSDSYKLDYSTETWSSSANSTFVRKNGGATSTTTNAYIGGGSFGNVPSLGTNHQNDMDKYTYTTSTFTRIPGSNAGDIPGPAYANKQCAAGNQTQGYWAFGPAQSKCSKLTYSNETASNLPNLPWNAKNSVGVSMQTAGYYGSGDGFDDENTSFVRITFSNDSYAAYSGWFYTPGGFGARYRCGSSSSTKAYIIGGQNAPRCMDVIPWATNSTSNSPTTFLPSPGHYKAPGQGSNEAGYFTGGGMVGNNGTTTTKITYASDTAAILPGSYFPTSAPSGINSYSTGGPNMNGLGTNVPNVI